MHQRFFTRAEPSFVRPLKYSPGKAAALSIAIWYIILGPSAIACFTDSQYLPSVHVVHVHVLLNVMSCERITEFDWTRQDLVAEQLVVRAVTRPPVPSWLGGVARETKSDYRLTLSGISSQLASTLKLDLTMPSSSFECFLMLPAYLFPWFILVVKSPSGTRHQPKQHLQIL